MLTPEQVHFGQADQIIARREAVLRTAWAAHPDRFVSGQPKQKPLPEAVYQSSHPIPHHTGNCSLINPEECLTIVDRFRGVPWRAPNKCRQSRPPPACVGTPAADRR